jgi:surfactin synthase thioesterase subunit
MNINSWLLREPSGSHRFRLYCFCYAGGNALCFKPWQKLLGPEIEVCAIQLPGRGARRGEAPYDSMPALVETLAHVIGRDSKLPFAFFGHSLGGLLAFELARYCQRYYLPMPKHLFASGCSAPQHRSPSKNLHKLSDDDLIDALREYNGTPPEILAHRELMALVLPTIRADFSLAENYQHKTSLPLPIPITVLAGTLDDRSSPDQAEGWKKETTNACRVQWFEGDHFFINPEQAAVVKCIGDELAKLIPNQALSSTSSSLEKVDLTA